MVIWMKKKSYWYAYVLLFGLFFFLVSRIVYLNYENHAKYEELLKQKTEIYIEGDSAPRGRILDVNGEVLVDNVLVERISYRKINNPSFEEEVSYAEALASLMDVEEANEKELRNFYALRNPEKVNALISEEEREMVQTRKLESSVIESWKRERISKDAIDEMPQEEKRLAKIYALMNTGYSYQNKVLVTDADASLIARVVVSNIPGVFIDSYWKRSYPYGDLLRSVFGTIREGLPEDRQEEYLSQGYALTDVVGVSYLEEEYESYLIGEKAVYFVNADKSLTLVKEAKRGNDLVLSIDIHLEEKLDQVVKDTLLRVKKMPNTEYLKENYALISDPETGAIRAMVGRRILDNGKDVTFQEISSNTFLSAFTSGSIVKGASHTVGYLNGMIDLDKKIKDSCVKLYLVPEKCSYKELGYLDDISALKWSSNYYQFLTAIKMSGKTYSYNMKLDASSEVFEKYRSVFALYGLGSKTGLDVPNEQTGMIGSTLSDDLLLNLTIGQYDTYTPVELLQYINTIFHNGERLSLHLMKEIRTPEGDVLVSYEPEVLSNIDLDGSYYDRIREGFRQVLYNGTGSGYVSRSINAYGKTGTSESFYDSNGDGVVDTKTISSTFAMIGPEKDFSYSLVLVTPNLSHYGGVKDYTAPFNRYISTEMSEFLLYY